MKRCATPIGWPRYDPRHYRFAISNAVWEYSLKPVEFLIFSYLCYCDSRSPANQPAPDEVAAGVRVSAETAKKHMEILVSKGLVTDKLAPAADLRCTGKGKFFSLPNEIFLLRLPPSAFMVYAYLLLIENRKTHTCHPSYNTLASAAGIAKNTAMKSVEVLLEAGLITMEHSRYYDQHGMKWKGNNLYTVLPISGAVDLYVQRQIQQMESGVNHAGILRGLEAHGKHPA